MKQQDDYLWKGILEDVFDDFLRFLDPRADEIFDLTKGITFLDKELEQLFPPDNQTFAPKVVDKLAQIYTRQGHPQWILIHVEVQGRYQPDFPRRMFTYYYRILDKYQLPIAAYAILTESTTRPRSAVFQESCLGTHLRYRFQLYKIAEAQPQQLLASANPFAWVVLTARAALENKKRKDPGQSDQWLLQTKIQLARQLLSRTMEKEKIRVLIIIPRLKEGGF